MQFSGYQKCKCKCINMIRQNKLNAVGLGNLTGGYHEARDNTVRLKKSKTGIQNCISHRGS